MKIYDISLTISPHLPVWPGDPSPVLEQVMFMSDGEIANVTRLNMGVHTGTHVDAPHHFLNDNRTVDRLPLSVLIGPCFVANMADSVDIISVRDLEKAEIPVDTRRILFKTRNSKLWNKADHPFTEDFVAVSSEGSEWLVNRGIELVGVDYLSVAPFNDPIPTHQILLKAGVVIVEGLNLSDVDQGSYDLYCLPVKLEKCDGAPARAILIKNV